jgi:WD40-like Beta Propeller Repeat
MRRTLFLALSCPCHCCGNHCRDDRDHLGDRPNHAVTATGVRPANLLLSGRGSLQRILRSLQLDVFVHRHAQWGTDGPNDTEPTWSADDTKIAFTRNNDIFVSAAAGGPAVNITNTGNNQDPAWSPDGTKIAFMSTRDGHSEVYLMNPDGSNVVRLTYNIAAGVGHPAWSGDGAHIAFNCQVESGNRDICAVNPDGAGFVRLTTDSASESGPTWSPDSQSIAFSSSQYGIAVMSADGSDLRQGGREFRGGTWHSRPMAHRSRSMHSTATITPKSTSCKRMEPMLASWAWVPTVLLGPLGCAGRHIQIHVQRNHLQLRRLWLERFLRSNYELCVELWGPGDRDGRNHHSHVRQWQCLYRQAHRYR